jgi:hypothetical protein
MRMCNGDNHQFVGFDLVDNVEWKSREEMAANFVLRLEIGMKGRAAGMPFDGN